MGQLLDAIESVRCCSSGSKPASNLVEFRMLDLGAAGCVSIEAGVETSSGGRNGLDSQAMHASYHRYPDEPPLMQNGVPSSGI